MDGHSSRRAICEPFKIRVMEPLPLPSRVERGQAIREAGCKLFLVASKQVTFDFLTDSGTTTRNANQWGAMMALDESYAGSRSFEKFERVVRDLTGYQYVIPTHEGRAAERLLFSYLVRPELKVPSNKHFDYILEGMTGLMCRKETIRGLPLTYEPLFLRQFTARFEPVE